jgi:hypothetical protein
MSGVGSRCRFDPTHVTSAAMIMYYGGDTVSIIVMVILCAGWIRHPRRIPLGGDGQAKTS